MEHLKASNVEKLTMDGKKFHILTLFFCKISITNTVIRPELLLSACKSPIMLGTFKPLNKVVTGVKSEHFIAANVLTVPVVLWDDIMSIACDRADY